MQLIMRKINGLKVIQMLELADRDTKSVITTVFHMF